MAQKEVKTRRNQQVQEVIREQVVEYLKKELGTQKQAAEIFGLAERSINRIWARYNEGGKRGLGNKKRGVKEGKKITGKQAAEVRRLIKYKLPDN